MNSRIAPVTGATSGASRTFTRYLDSGGSDVVAVNRRTDRMGPTSRGTPRRQDPPAGRGLVDPSGHSPLTVNGTQDQ